MSVPEVPRETQRFIVALVLIGGFFAVFGYVFHVTRDAEPRPHSKPSRHNSWSG
jgi:hypothetical protein